MMAVVIDANESGRAGVMYFILVFSIGFEGEWSLCKVSVIPYKK